MFCIDPIFAKCFCFLLRWRYECDEWCGRNPSGLCCFEKTDPAKYGFDSAIEFPPVGLDAENITSRFSPLTEFQGSSHQVFDYKSFVAYSNQYESLDYTLFRGVMPSWDNTARRMSNGSSIIHHSSPKLFKEWLLNASMWSKRQAILANNSDLDIVFINAWNEWAEGCHLETDIKFGYQWLEAVSAAQQLAKQIQIHSYKDCVKYYLQSRV